MENIILEFAQFDPVTLGIIAGGKVASGVYNWFKGKRKSVQRTMSPDEARFRSQLYKRSQEGIYDKGNMREIISRVGRSASEVADKGRQFALGQLQGQGLGKSAVGHQIANKYNTQVSRAVSDSARDVAIANIGTKVKAQDQLGRIGMDDTERNYQQKIRERAEKDKYYDKAFGDLVGGASGLLTAKFGDPTGGVKPAEETAGKVSAYADVVTPESRIMSKFNPYRNDTVFGSDGISTQYVEQAIRHLGGEGFVKWVDTLPEKDRSRIADMIVELQRQGRIK